MHYLLLTFTKRENFFVIAGLYYKNVHENNDFAEGSKILLDTDLIYE